MSTPAAVRYEYRVVWKRKDIDQKTRRYATRAGADRFLKLLGPEPWTAFGEDPDAFACCGGRRCECGHHLTVREKHADQSLLPAIEYARVERREIGAWEATA